MKAGKWAPLRRGNYIVVRYGARGGTQLAKVLGPHEWRGRYGDRFPVQKWREKSRTWTDRVFVRPDQIVAGPIDELGAREVAEYAAAKGAQV